MEPGVGSFRALGAVRQNHAEDCLFPVWQVHQGRIGELRCSGNTIP